MPVTQSYIDQLIQVINDAVEAGSVTNVMVATVMDYLNSRDKALAQEVANRLSRVSPDTALGKIIFSDGAEFGHFVRSMSAGMGGAIDSRGNAQLESLEVRSYLKVLELIINKISVVGSEYYFTEGHTIEEVTEESNGTYTLRFKKNHENDIVEFQPFDVLKGIVNDLAQGGGTYYTAWFRVNSVNQASFTANVYLYPDAQVPAAHNFPPCEMMACKRWGNALGANERNHELYPAFIVPQGDGYINTRQSCIYISSLEKRIVFLDGVTQPILVDGDDGSNYAAFFGLPISIYALRNVNLNPHQPYLYCRGLFVQDLQQITYNGIPKRGLTVRGAWNLDTALNDPYDFSQFNQDVVFHLGCMWGCKLSGTITEPRFNSTHWELLEGLQELKMDFVSSRGSIFYARSVDTQVTPIIYMGGMDISADQPETVGYAAVVISWVWTRYGEGRTDEGAADAGWNTAHVNNGRVLHITNADMPVQWSRANKAIFTCTAYIRVGDEIEEISNQVTV